MSESELSGNTCDTDNTIDTINIDKDSLKSKKILKKVFTKREIYYLKRVDRYFRGTGKQYIPKMIEIINKTSKISLRMLDWFAAKYAKKNKKKVAYLINGEYFSVRIGYTAQLDSFTKKNFDPFRRRKKFYYNYDRSNLNLKLLTTIGQLNFFMWAFEHKIINYIETNYDELSQAMKQSNKEDKQKKENKKKNKIKSPPNQKLKQKTKKKISTDNKSVIVVFD